MPNIVKFGGGGGASAILIESFGSIDPRTLSYDLSDYSHVVLQVYGDWYGQRTNGDYQANYIIRVHNSPITETISIGGDGGLSTRNVTVTKTGITFSNGNNPAQPGNHRWAGAIRIWAIKGLDDLYLAKMGNNVSPDLMTE